MRSGPEIAEIAAPHSLTSQCYRVSTEAEYQQLREAFQQHGEMLEESMIGEPADCDNGHLYLSGLDSAAAARCVTHTQCAHPRPSTISERLQAVAS